MPDIASDTVLSWFLAAAGSIGRQPNGREILPFWRTVKALPADYWTAAPPADDGRIAPALEQARALQATLAELDGWPAAVPLRMALAAMLDGGNGRPSAMSARATVLALTWAPGIQAVWRCCRRTNVSADSDGGPVVSVLVAALAATGGPVMKPATMGRLLRAAKARPAA